MSAQKMTDSGWIAACADCTVHTVDVPVRESDLKPGAHKRDKEQFDPTYRVAKDVRILALTEPTGEVVYVTTAWAAYIFSKALKWGNNFHEKHKPLIWPYDRHCVEFLRRTRTAYEDGQSGNDTVSCHDRLPYLYWKELNAQGVSDVIIVEDLAELNAVMAQVRSCRSGSSAPSDATEPTPQAHFVPDDRHNPSPQKVEERIMNMARYLERAAQVIDSLPVIPADVKERLKVSIAGDPELSGIMQGLETRRTPRLMLIGRTGVGKSSLINALSGAYVAPISGVESCTADVASYECRDAAGRVLFEVLDTRGIAESQSIRTDQTAEEAVTHAAMKFMPDVILLVLSAIQRDNVDRDAQFLHQLRTQLRESLGVSTPIVAVLNKCDGLAPSRCKIASEYPQSKLDRMDEATRYYKSLIDQQGLENVQVVPVSSCIDWESSDGVEVSESELREMPPHKSRQLSISFDGRYGIDTLREIMINAVDDPGVRMGFIMAYKIEAVMQQMAKHLTAVFAGVSATVALTPIPVSDVYILLVLQALLVTLIASLSGRDVSMETAKEFILGLGGIAGVGFGLRIVAQQATKFLNMLCPGVGSSASAAIAYAGTYAIGQSAIRYYLGHASMEETRRSLDTSRRDGQRDFAQLEHKMLPE